MERVGIMAVARGARKTANTSFVISIRRTRTVTMMVMASQTADIILNVCIGAFFIVMFIYAVIHMDN